MNKVEQWEKWELVSGLRGTYYIDLLCKNKYGLKIVLINIEDNNKEIHVLFDSGVYCFRDTYDSYVDDRMIAASERQGKELFCSTMFFKVTNSEYIKWVSEQSGGVSDCQPLEHLVIFGQDSMLEFLTNYRPRVEIVDLS